MLDLITQNPHLFVTMADAQAVSPGSSDIIRSLGDNLVPVLAITLTALVGMIVAPLAILRSMVVGKAREQTKREIAAYIAEGSISAEEGERLIRARMPETSSDD